MRAAPRWSPRRRYLDVGFGHDADHDVLHRLGEAVVHLLAEDDHLSEDGSRLDDGGRECAAVGGDPEDPDTALFEDEECFDGLVRGVDE